jgi:hypothetical protein
MKKPLSVLAVIGSLACTAAAEKFAIPDPVVLSRQNLDVYSRTETCIAVTGHAPNTIIEYVFTLEDECCDWFVSGCASPFVDTMFNLLESNVILVATNDDDHCAGACLYDPAEIGSNWGDTCLPAGTYTLEIYLFWGFDNACDYVYDPLDYTFCFDFCDNGAAGADDQPVSFELGDAFPNPFNPSTTISFSLAETADASLKVYNMAGAEVASLVSGLTAAGQHSVTFDAASLTSGVYFYTLEVAGLTQTRKMVLVK